MLPSWKFIEKSNKVHIFNLFTLKQNKPTIDIFKLLQIIYQYSIQEPSYKNIDKE